MRNIVFFVAIALAAVVFFVVYFLFGEEEEAVVVQQPAIVAEPQIVERREPTVNIFVARQPIQIGTVLTRAMLDIQPWPEHLLLEGIIVVDAQGNPSMPIEGMVARATFQPNEPLLQSKLSNPTDPSFLAAQLPAGMRAATISTSEVEGVAGFVQPGDRVDVLLSHSVDQDGAEGPVAPIEVTEVLLTDVRVLAVDQRATGGGTGGGEDGIQPPRSISLEVDPIGVQKLKLGEQTGRLSLALRSIQTTGDYDDETYILPPLAEPQLTQIPIRLHSPKGAEEESKGPTVTVVRKVTAEEVEVDRP